METEMSSKDETRTRWISVGVVLRVEPNYLEQFLMELKTTPGVYVVYYKTSRLKLHLQEVPY